MQQLDSFLVRRLVAQVLDEDIGRGDLTTQAVVPPERTVAARLEARGTFVVAGLEVARACFEHLGGGAVAWSPAAKDGYRVDPGMTLARLEGPAHPILTGERTALNLLARLSGIATLTASFVEAVSGTPARIVDTRKTTPGLRVVEKYAVRVGGGFNHRFGLDDGILIKDNHIAAVGSISEAIARAKARSPHGLRVEVEVEDMTGVDEALASGADALLLDNMTPGDVREAVVRAGGKALLEVSGGITLDNVRAYADTGVDLISVGRLTHAAPAADVALEVAR